MIARKLVKGRLTAHKAPFDIVDFRNSQAYEVKTVSAATAKLPIHIAAASMERKQAFAKRYNLAMTLIVVVVHGPRRVEVFTGELKCHTAITQLSKIK